jgi:homoserine dehydrogenase
VAFGARVVAGDVYREGISGITAADITAAHRLGYAVKLLAVVEHTESDPALNQPETIAVRVHPAMMPTTHPLASVRDSYNAVFVEGDAVGQLMFLGRGAGGMPTASAVLGDLLDAAHNRTVGGAGRTVALHQTQIRPIDDLRSAYYLTLEVADRPGVLGTHHVSIRLMEQEALEGAEPVEGAGAKLVFVTHPAFERDMQACIHDLRHLDVVSQIGGLLRVIGP